MAAEAREYELVLMLDPGLEESARDALAEEARGQIESGGSVKHEDAWGLRKMAYEIEQRTEADYRWFRFEASRDLLGQLDHNLKIADGVLRFRVFRVDPDSPVLGAPPAAGAPAPGRDRGDSRSGPGRDRGDSRSGPGRDRADTGAPGRGRGDSDSAPRDRSGDGEGDPEPAAGQAGAADDSASGDEAGAGGDPASGDSGESSAG